MYCIWIFSNKLNLNPETSFYYMQILGQPEKTWKGTNTRMFCCSFVDKEKQTSFMRLTPRRRTPASSEARCSTWSSVRPALRRSLCVLWGGSRRGPWRWLGPLEPSRPRSWRRSPPPPGCASSLSAETRGNGPCNGCTGSWTYWHLLHNLVLLDSYWCTSQIISYKSID